MSDYAELRRAVQQVDEGAKMGEVTYGDDGVDMAEDIALLLEERDRYLRALVEIGNFSAADADGGHLISIALRALTDK